MNIFVFCAGNRKARENYNASVLQPVQAGAILPCFPGDREEWLRAIEKRSGGFYIWGFGAGRRCLYVWRKVMPGDVVIGFFDFHYRVVAQVAAKEECAALAERVWAPVRGGVETWKNIVFLSRPQEVAVKAMDLVPYMCSTYRGATPISTSRAALIRADFGTLEDFLLKKFNYTTQGA